MMNDSHEPGSSPFAQQIADEVRAMARSQGIEFDESNLNRVDDAATQGVTVFFAGRRVVLAAVLGAFAVVVRSLSGTVL